MIAPVSLNRPFAALGRRLTLAMNVILHIGAHRCATTSFQHYLRYNSDRLQARAVGFWGPHRTRNGLFSGVLPGPVPTGGGDPAKRAAGRIRLACTRSRALGTEHLVVSDENILGSVRENLRLGNLYCGAGERIARFVQAFDGAIGAIVLNIRSLDHYWSSALAYSLTRGMLPPGDSQLSRLARGPRGWRDVVQDVAAAAGGVPVQVYPYETFAGQPEAQLARMTGVHPPMAEARVWLNRSPDLGALRGWMAPHAGSPAARSGRWMPFAPDQANALRERYADDILWLADGAGGAATLMTGQPLRRPGQTGPAHDMTRGRCDDRQDGRVAQAR